MNYVNIKLVVENSTNRSSGAFWFWVLIIFVGFVWWGNSTHTETVTQTVPCQYETRQTELLYEGQTQVIQNCREGKKTVKTTYSNWDNSQKGQSVITYSPEAKNQITAVGAAKMPVISVPSYSSTPLSTGGRTGAICSDGWTSSSTGSGTCSHHGGVSYWTY